jgi:hypothetical protein
VPERLLTYAASLVVDWMAERDGAAFELDRVIDGDVPVFMAKSSGRRLALAVAELWEPETDAAAEDARQMMEERLSGGNVRGPYLVWVPPKATVPGEEPAASDFVMRVQMACAPMQPGARNEIDLPVSVQMAKVRDEGGYASVIGGLSRFWTLITERVDGTFHVNSSALRRAPQSETTRTALFDRVGELSKGLKTGDALEFDSVEAWTVQRLAEAPLGESGFAIAQAPPKLDSSDGTVMRRLVRKRLGAAEAHREAGRAAAFYIEIDRVLREVLAARLGRSVTGLRRDELQQLLGGRGLPEETTTRVLGELEACDQARFAPGGQGEAGAAMAAALARADELIGVIEKAALSEHEGGRA